ncbi:MAG: multiprotein-bridging factor 1 family protein [Gemmatimonadales bacterium]|jgi:transcriptional regulator with XRE-family HTH domain
MRRKESAFAAPAVIATSRHLGALVRQARLARAWTQVELAERARIGTATLKRIEAGAVEASLGAWLSVLDRLGLLPLLQSLKDPASAALLSSTQTKRSRNSRKDLDF